MALNLVPVEMTDDVDENARRVMEKSEEIRQEHGSYPATVIVRSEQDAERLFGRLDYFTLDAEKARYLGFELNPHAFDFQDNPEQWVFLNASEAEFDALEALG